MSQQLESLNKLEEDTSSTPSSTKQDEEAVKSSEPAPFLEKPKRKSGTDLVAMWDECPLHCVRCNGWYSWLFMYDNMDELHKFDCGLITTFNTKEPIFAVQRCPYCDSIPLEVLYDDENCRLMRSLGCN